MVFYVVGLDNWQRSTLNLWDTISSVNNDNQSFSSTALTMTFICRQICVFF